jgi:hypothetical protein
LHDFRQLLKIDAERECIRLWRELPRQQRATAEQATTFAKALFEQVSFPTSGDRYAFIRGWLLRDLQLRGGL